MNPPTAMVAASIPVAKPTGMVNHREMRMPEVLKVSMGHNSIFWRRWARAAGFSSPPQRAQSRASLST
jgi:hypothetical protein